jgi:hypothetical protein
MTGRGRPLFALYVVSVGARTESPFLKRALGRGWKLSTSRSPMRQSVGEWLLLLGFAQKSLGSCCL